MGKKRDLKEKVMSLDTHLSNSNIRGVFMRVWSLTPPALPRHSTPHNLRRHRAGSKRLPSEASAAGLDTPAAVSSGYQRNADHGGGQPYVTRAELQKILTREGEVLTDEEMDELLRECRPDDEGRIVYEGYRRMLIDPSL